MLYILRRILEKIIRDNLLKDNKIYYYQYIKIIRSGLSFLLFYYFHFLFNLILYFLFIELRVRVDDHRSQDIGKGVEGPRRGNIIQYVHHILALYLTHGHLG